MNPCIAILCSVLLAAGSLLGSGRAAGAAPPARDPTPASSGRWAWPLTPTPAVVGAFDPPAQNWLPGHRGVDLAASPDQPVLSPTDGTVTFSGWVVHRGIITVTARTGQRISFEPVTGQLPRGEAVRRGQEIARRDPALPHAPCGSCLHWGVREGGRYLHPLAFVRGMGPSVLLPPPRPGRQHPGRDDGVVPRIRPPT